MGSVASHGGRPAGRQARPSGLDIDLAGLATSVKCCTRKRHQFAMVDKLCQHWTTDARNCRRYVWERRRTYSQYEWIHDGAPHNKDPSTSRNVGKTTLKDVDSEAEVSAQDTLKIGRKCDLCCGCPKTIPIMWHSRGSQNRLPKKPRSR